VHVNIELDRPTAIHDAIVSSKPGDIVVVAGKGADPYQKVRGIDTPYPTDMVVVHQVIDQL
jgi:UDP-N-acetylmuramoyl-L-alanyl-D-glutamate--2,6-diaminopimelate ligase